MNSAVMTCPGEYSLRRISRSEFIGRILAFWGKDDFCNYIGYQQNLDLIKKWSGGRINLTVSKKQTILADGDTMLCMTLKYRSEGYKGIDVNEKDFDFFICYFSNL